MASILSPTSPRGVLQPRDVNTSTPKYLTPQTSHRSGESASISTQSSGKIPQASSAQLGNSLSTLHASSPKRLQAPSSHDAMDDFPRQVKRARLESEEVGRDGQNRELVGVFERGEGYAHNSAKSGERVQPEGAADNLPYSLQISSNAGSPTSSFVSETTALNESQNTIYSEPDESMASFSRPTVHRLTKTQAREKAEALKLRLRLASYRVFTNQITTPWKDLEARTMTLGKLNISQSSPIPSPIRSHSRQRSQGAPPTTISHIRPIQPANTMPHMPSSPPVAFMHRRSASTSRDPASATKIVRQFLPPHDDSGVVFANSSFGARTAGRDGGGNAEEEEDADLNDRRVASDGLLSLMRQQDG